MPHERHSNNTLPFQVKISNILNVMYGFILPSSYWHERADIGMKGLNPTVTIRYKWLPTIAKKCNLAARDRAMNKIRC